MKTRRTTQKLKYGQSGNMGNSLITILTASVLFVGLSGCQSHDSVRLNNRSMVLLTVPIEFVRPKSIEAQNYGNWSKDFASIMKKHSFFYCTNTNEMLIAIDNEKTIDTVISEFDPGVKYDKQAYINLHASKTCAYDPSSHLDIRRIHFRKPIKYFERNFIKDFDDYAKFSMYTEFVSGGSDYTTSVEFAYPQGARYSDDDFNLILETVRKRYGPDCCILDKAPID
jgi:hypothetical protein